MKKKLIAVVAAVLVVGALGVTACTKEPVAENNTATAYGQLHQQYAGRVTVTADKDKKIQDVLFEEFLPIQDIGNVNNLTVATITSSAITTTAVTIDDNAKVGDIATRISLSSGNVTVSKSTFAKYIKIGGEMFVLTEIVPAATGDTNSHALYGYRNATWANGTTWELPVRAKLSSQKGTDEVTHSAQWLPEGKKNAYQNVEFTKWYIEQMEAGNFYVCKNEAGTETYNPDFQVYGTAKVTKKTWANKNINGYWSPSTSANTQTLGWKMNMAAMRAFLIGKNFDTYTGQEDIGYFGGDSAVNTGATLADYHDYMGLAKKAYEEAIKLFV